MPDSVDDESLSEKLKEASGDLAEEIAENWDAIHGAAMLIQMDMLIQKWCKKVDELAEAAIDELPHREAQQPDFSCEEDKAAVKVSLTLKAVHLGTVKLIHKIIPREILKFIEKQFVDVFEALGAKVLTKKVLGNINVAIKAAIDVAVGSATAIDYMDDLEKSIHNVLGCSIEDEEKPMRFELNEWIENMKNRNAGESRPMKMVATRHHTELTPKKAKAKKRKKGSKKQPTDGGSMHSAKDY